MSRRGITFGNIYDIFILIIVFIISMIISPLYIEGDQKVYIEVYEEISSSNSNKLFILYLLHDKYGDISFFYIYFVSQLIEKDIAMSIVNCLIAFLASRIFRKAGLNYFLNFYCCSDIILFFGSLFCS